MLSGLFQESILVLLSVFFVVFEWGFELSRRYQGLSFLNEALKIFELFDESFKE